MLFARIVLFASALAFAGTGGAFLLHPVEMTALVGIELTETVSLSDVRAVYGGLELGAALVLALLATNASTLRLGLMAQIAFFSGLVVGRVASLAADGPPNSPGFMLFGLEVAALVLGAVAFALSRPRAALSASS